MSDKYLNLSNAKGKNLEMWSRLLQATPSELLTMSAEDANGRLDIVSKKVENWMEHDETKAASENTSENCFSIEGYNNPAEEMEKICHDLTDHTGKNRIDLTDAQFKDFSLWQTVEEALFSDPKHSKKCDEDNSNSRAEKDRQNEPGCQYESKFTKQGAPHKMFQGSDSLNVIRLSDLKTPMYMSPSNSDVQLFKSLSASAIRPIRLRAGETNANINYEDFSRDLRANEAADGRAFSTQNNQLLSGADTSSYRAPGERSLNFREFMGPGVQAPSSRNFHSIPMRNFDESGRAANQFPSRVQANTPSFYTIPYEPINRPQRPAGSAASNQCQHAGPRSNPEGYPPNIPSGLGEDYGDENLPPDYVNGQSSADQRSYPIYDPPDYQRRVWPSVQGPYSSNMPGQPTRDTRIQNMSDFSRQLADFKRQLQGLQSQSQGWISRPATATAPYVTTMGAIGLPHIEAHLQIYFLGPNQTIGYGQY